MRQGMERKLGTKQRTATAQLEVGGAAEDSHSKARSWGPVLVKALVFPIFLISPPPSPSLPTGLHDFSHLFSIP